MNVTPNVLPNQVSSIIQSNLFCFQIGLNTFGERFELELNRNLNLVPSHRPLNVFYADKEREDIQYAASDEVNIKLCISDHSC